MRAKQTMNAGPTDCNIFTQKPRIVFKVLAGRTEGPAYITRERPELAEEGNDSLVCFFQKFPLRSGPGSIVNTILVVIASHPSAYGLYMTTQKTGNLSIFDVMFTQNHDA